MHDLLAHLVERDARNLAIEMANVQNGESILEVAVGTGLSFERLLDANPDGATNGIDATPEMLERAKTRASRHDATSYSLSIGDAYALDFPDNSFDLVVNGYMLDLLPISDFIPVLREFERVVKPSGRIVLHYLTLPTRWYHRLWDGLYSIHPFFLGGCRGISVIDHLALANLKLTRREFVSQMTFPTEILLCNPLERNSA